MIFLKIPWSLEQGDGLLRHFRIYVGLFMKGIYILSLSMILLEGSFAWISLSWMTSTSLGMMGIISFLSCLLFFKNKNKISSEAICAYLLLSLSGFFAYGFSFNGLSKFPLFLVVLTFFMLKTADLKKILLSLNNLFAIVIFISVILHVFYLGGISLPNLGNVYYNQYDFINIFYIYLPTWRYGDSFTGFTIEPGFIGLFLVCFLLINEFDFKKNQTLVYFLALILSLSLGGYLLCFVGFVLQRSLSKGKIFYLLKVTSLTLCVLGFIAIIALNYNGGDNILVEEIISRLAFDEELGIVGNNRETEVAKPIIDNLFYSNSIWMGIGQKRFLEAIDVKYFDACSWRLFVIVHGAIYTSVFFVLSLFYIRKTNLKKTIPFFVVYWLDFIQHGMLFSESMYLLLLYMNINMRDNSINLPLSRINDIYKQKVYEKKSKSSCILPATISSYS